MATGTESHISIELGSLGLDRGGHLLIDRALRSVPVGSVVQIVGTDPLLPVHLPAWARRRGHTSNGLALIKGGAGDSRWRGAERAGSAAVAMDCASASWGLAARGSLVELGGPPLSGADLAVKAELWTDLVPKLYAQAIASQWDPNTAFDWDQRDELPEEIESAVVQVMTFLIENEQAALLVPARFIGRVHPHFREVLQMLAVQLADEARHLEVFTRRAALRSPLMGTSGASGRASLQTLLDESEFSVAMFLLSVLGEGTFLHFLSFIELNAPDRLTATIAHLVLQDEARHVAFGMGHLQEQLRLEPALRERLAAAIVRRHTALAHTAGLNEDVFDALIVLAAGSWKADAIGQGYAKVQALEREMDEGRQKRLIRLGFETSAARELSSLHTRNFM